MSEFANQLAEVMAAKNCYTEGAISPGTLPNSLLPVDTANRFIDETVNESVLLSKVRVLRVNACSGKIPKLDLAGPVTEGACATSCPTSHVPTENSLFYELVKYRSYFEIESDFLRCNLERGRVVDTIMGMFRKGIGTDSEIAAISSDDAITYGDDQSALHNLLGVNNGWLKEICGCVPECNVIDAAGASPSKDLYYQAKGRIPTRYRRELNRFRWIAAPQVVDHWDYYWSLRITDGGDRALASGESPGPWGVNFLEVPLWPENMPYGSAGTPVSHILLTPPDNLVFIRGMDLKVERERIPKCDMEYFVMHHQMDFMVLDVNKAVIIKNVNVCGAPYADCTPCGPNNTITLCGA